MGPLLLLGHLMLSDFGLAAEFNNVAPAWAGTLHYMGMLFVVRLVSGCVCVCV